MLFDAFRSAFDVTAQVGARWMSGGLEQVTGYHELAAEFAGCSFDGGLYRVHNSLTGPVAQCAVAEAFPEYADRATPFAFDWLGRQFAVDAARMVDHEPQILLLEPGTGEALEIPCGLVDFHNSELVEYRDAALASEFFEAWAETNPERLPIPMDSCVGYCVPLFLGGTDTIDNLEMVDLEIYWSICAQLRHGTASLPPGTSIAGIIRSVPRD